MGTRKFSWVFLFLFTVPILAQYLDDPCNLPGGQNGICKSIGLCPSAIQALERQIRPQLCGFVGRDPIVCCATSGNIVGPDPTPEQVHPGDKSIKKCEEYSVPIPIVSNLPPGQVVLAAVGGVQSLSKEFPHMAALGFENGADVAWYCGGSLISKKYVLTAAHCLNHRELGQIKFVRLGDLNLQNNTDDADPQNFTVIRRIPHPQYRPPQVYHDIALLLLDREATFTWYVKPICLQVTHDIEVPDYLKPSATGWGKTEYGGVSSDVLIKVQLELFSLDECNAAFKQTARRRLPNGVVDNGQICAGGRNVVMDTCQGDSGGPLQIRNGTHYDLIGITSFGIACGTPNVPAVYTRISNYIKWIEDIVWPENDG